MIEVTNISKNIGPKNILENISLSIPKGNICGLIGRNGAGKTSLIKCLMGLWKLDSGTIKINNLDTAFDFKFKEFTAFIPDEINIPAYFTINEAVTFYKYSFQNFDRDHFNKLLKLYNIDTNEKIKELSRGFKLKLLISLNLARKPDIIVLDEPLSNLDPVSRKELINTLIGCALEKEITILISTHNILDVQKFCDTFIVMDRGRILDSGSTDYFKDKIRMVNVVFPGKIPDEIHSIANILEIKTLGKSTNIIIKNFSEDALGKIKKLGAKSVKLMDLDLEEIVVYLLGGKNFETVI